MPIETLIRTLWRWRWRLCLAALLLWLPLLALVWSWPRSYVAEAVVAPAETTSMAASALLAPGINVQAGLFDTRPGGNFGVYLAALRRAEAARMLTERTAVIDQLTRQRAEGPVGWLRRLLGLRIQADLDDVRRMLERRLAVTQDSAALTWTISLPWRDREAAETMLALLHAHAEAKVRADLAEMARRRIAALEARIAAERDAYLRSAMFDLLAQQQRAALVVAADEAVAARLVSAPMVELRPSQPNRPLLTLLLVLAVPAFCAMAAATLAVLRAAPHPALP
ncbi:MAG: hypothetical protein RMK64_10300 [Rhodovarius sp.]|nr:hypothetical protein [Rhodovarius sp.]